MLHDYLTIALFLGLIGLGLWTAARLTRLGGDWRRTRRTRRIDARLRGVVMTRVGAAKVQLPEHAPPAEPDARTVSPSPD